MIKRIVFASFALAPALLLSACGPFNPQTTMLPHEQQCRVLQRQMLFIDNFRNQKNSHFQNNVKRQKLREESQKLRCNAILTQARQQHGQPNK